MYYEFETGYLVITWADKILASLNPDFIAGYTFGFFVTLCIMARLNRSEPDWTGVDCGCKES